ncbi:MAG: DUF6923 family protein [Wenzhouxiangellaceae bacterium]
MKIVPGTLLLTVLAALLLGGAGAVAQTVGYSINSNGNFTDDDLVFALWRVQLDTGETEFLGSTRGGNQFFDIEGLSLSTDGFLYGADDTSKSLVRISPSTGVTSAVNFQPNNMGVPLLPNLDFGVTFTCTGRLLVSSAATGMLFEANPSTGRLTELGSLGAPIVDLAVVGAQVYGLGQGSPANGYPASRNLYRIDPVGPSVELIGSLGPAVSPYLQAGLAADESGQLWAITNRNDVNGDGQALPGEILRIDRSTGEAETVGETIVGIESLAITASTSCDDPDNPDGDGEPLPFVVPAMTPLGLLALALLLLAITVRRFARD